MKLKSTVLMALIVCALAGCTKDYHEVKKADLNFAFIGNSSGTFKGYYYQGSDAHFHYFISKWQFGKDRRFKIRKDDLEVTAEHPHGHGEARVYAMKPRNEEINSGPFAVIGKQTIYIEL